MAVNVVVSSTSYYFIEPDDFKQHPVTSLIEAARQGDVGTVRQLLRQGVDPDLAPSKVQPPLPPQNPPLVEAIAHGQRRAAELILDAARNLEVTDVVYGGTPLHWAAGAGDEEVVEALLQRGANPLARTWEGYTPLHSAASFGNSSLLRLLLQRGLPADVRADSSQETPLHLAAGKGHPACATVLVNAAADVNATDALQRTPLICAACGGHLPVVRVLLAGGADAAAADQEHGRTALHWAAWFGHHGVAEALTGSGVDTADLRGETPLLLACRRGHDRVVVLLLEKGAVADVRNQVGVTPLISACFFGHDPVVKLLLGRGVEVRAVDTQKRRTALHWAALNDNAVVVQSLLTANSGGWQLADAEGRTPLDVAMEADAIEAVQLLRSVLG